MRAHSPSRKVTPQPGLGGSVGVHHVEMEGLEHGRNRCVCSLEWARLGFDNEVLLEHKEGAGHGGSTGLSQELNLRSADLRGCDECGLG